MTEEEWKVAWEKGGHKVSEPSNKILGPDPISGWYLMGYADGRHWVLCTYVPSSETRVGQAWGMGFWDGQGDNGWVA